MNEVDPRFGGIERLYSASALQRLGRAHVCVIGLGGVGSWAAEALARSAIGEITLVDLDDICVTNINRQLHALDTSIGSPKVAVMAARIQAINPRCRVRTVPEFFTESTAGEILASRFDCVLDAIDQVSNKCLLIAQCREKSIPIVSVGAAGGRKNPAVVELADLAQTSNDSLLQQVRKKLRDDYGFPRDPKKPFHVPCVFSREPAVYPQTGAEDCSTHGADLRLNCDSGYGSASFVTGTFGFIAAAHIVSEIAEQKTGDARGAQTSLRLMP